jgi:hypothetical protein
MCPSSSDLAGKQAEGVTCRIEHDPNGLLWLVFSKRCSRLKCLGDSGIEVVDSYIEVNHHLLLPLDGRPYRW